MTGQEIATKLENSVGWVMLNRASMRNAISKSMWDAIPSALAELRVAGARVIVFKGEGDSFCAGADLGELKAISSIEQAKSLWLSIHKALNAVAAFELPTMAVIHGACMGGGCLLACACDMRLCNTDAKFSIPVAALGIILDDDNIRRLVALVGRGWASQLLLSAEVIDALTARRIGLVNEICANDTLYKQASEVAARVARNAAESVIPTKKAIATLAGSLASQQDQTHMIESYLSEAFRVRVDQALSKGTKPE